MISFNDLSLSFGSQVLYQDVSININPKDRIGLIGRNGTGKSTLFALINKELQPDSGNISIPKNYSIGTVKQVLEFTKDFVLEEACLGLRPDQQYDEWRVEKLLTGLGFSEEDFYKDPRSFSGGYQIRLNLVKVLAGEPDMLLLDEPTNYLDLPSMRWLQGFLKNWPGEFILITHDRHFMDAVTNHSMIIHRGKLRKLKGSSIDLMGKIEEEEEIYEKTRLNQEKKDKKTQAFIDTFRYKANFARLVQSRIKTLEKSQKLARLDDIQTLDFAFNPAPFQAKIMMKANQLNFSYGDDLPQLVKNFSLEIGYGDRICIIGKNGVGKSTLLRLLSGHLTPTSGEVTSHSAVEMGYFGQTNISTLSADNTIEEELASAMTIPYREKVRTVAGVMMFSGDLALKRVKVLSGGEKSRVLLGKILLKPTNLLLLDEPTHHLDMDSCDELVEAIESFPGASIIVTHDESFLHLLAQKLVVFTEKGIKIFHGSYQDFLNKGGF